jgi:hypothetical protein
MGRTTRGGNLLLLPDGHCPGSNHPGA